MAESTAKGGQRLGTNKNMGWVWDYNPYPGRLIWYNKYVFSPCSISHSSSVYVVKGVKQVHNQSNRPVDCMEDFVKRHENKIYRIAIAIMGNKADAEDIMQDVFLKVLENKTPHFESVEHETAWLTRVTVNHCRNRLRSHWWKKTEPLLDIYPAQDNEQQYLLETVNTLPSKYRIVIVLFYYEGYSTNEIADITGQKEPTVRSQLTRARHILKEFLEGEPK